MGKSKDLASGNSADYVETAGDTITGNTVVATTTQVPLRIENTAANSLGSYLKIRDGNSTAGQHTWIGRSTNDTYIYSNNSDLGMKITSAGHVTKPNQPSFGVYRNAGAVTANNVYVFNGYDYNTGTMYNTNNGRGTAPVSGRYFVSTWMMCETNQEYTNYNYHIRKNGTTYKSVYSSNGGSGRHMQWSWAGTMGLAANDYIDIFTNNIRLYGSSHLYSAFCMHLLS